MIVRFRKADGDPENLARQFIRKVTLRALTDAPGLDVTGVFIETSSRSVDPADLERLDREFSEYSLNRRPAAARFPQFPFLERGSESALPASASLGDLEFSQESLQPNYFDESSPLSLPSRVKRAFASRSRQRQVDDVKERLTKQGKALKQEPEFDPTKLAAAFQDGEESEDAKNMLSSVGVVHIDGNGVGAIMRDLGSAHNRAQETGVCVSADEVHTDSDDALQTFIMVVNKRLDQAVKDAIALSWYDVQKLTPDTVVPIVPVLVGGDDVTVYTDGRYAIPVLGSLHPPLRGTHGEGRASETTCRRRRREESGPLTASAGAAIGRAATSRSISPTIWRKSWCRAGRSSVSIRGRSPCSTINFHVLRDATVLYPDDTLDEYKGRTQRPFLIGHYAPERIGDATTTSSEEAPTAELQPLPSWERILRAVAAFDGKKPDDPTQTTGDPFPRARANRIVKLLAEGDAEKAATEWDDALQNAPSAGLLAKQLKLLPPHSSSSDEAHESLKQIKWLLDLIDLSENLPDRYLALWIGGNADGDGSPETADGSTKGGAK